MLLCKKIFLLQKLSSPANRYEYNFIGTQPSSVHINTDKYGSWNIDLDETSGE